MPFKHPIVLPALALDEDVSSAPIDPTWILEGSPLARARRLAFIDDSALSATLWASTAGRFEWHYGSDELVVILDGEVEITPAQGRPFTLRPGDVVFVPAGQVLVFDVKDHLKKLAINAVRTPLMRRLATRVPFARQLVRRLRSARGRG